MQKQAFYEDNIRILFAVKAENIGGAEVKLNFYESDPQDSQAAATTLNPVYTPANSAEVGIAGHYVFFTPGFAAKFLSKQIYVQAEVTVDGVTYKSAVERYSVVEYCHEMIAKESTDAAKDAKYMDVIEYSAAIQSFLTDDGKYNGALATDYKYVTIKDGTLDGRYDAGIYLEGEKVYPQATGVTKWIASDGTKVANNDAYTIKDYNVAFAKETSIIDFENATVENLPSSIKFVDTYPALSCGTNTYSSSESRADIGSFAGNTTNSLILNNSRSYTRKSVLKISETAEAESNANVVEFSMKFNVDWSTSSTSDIEFINIVFADKDGNVAFNMILYYTSAGNLGMRFRNHDGSQPTYYDNSGKQETYQRTFLTGADAKWVELKLTYVSDGNTMALSVERDGAVFFTGANDPGAMVTPFNSNCVSASDITNAYVIVNGHSNAAHTVNNDMAIDDLMFKKTAK